jgi:hypothetical protein
MSLSRGSLESTIHSSSRMVTPVSNPSIEAVTAQRFSGS